MRHDTSAYNKSAQQQREVRQAARLKHDETRQKLKKEISENETVALFRLIKFGLKKGIAACQLRVALELCIYDAGTNGNGNGAGS